MHDAAPTQQLKPLKRVRAVFIGPGEAGKTSLIKALHGEDVIEGKEAMTAGVAIQDASLVALAAQTDFTVMPKTLDFLARMEATLRSVEHELQRQEQTAEVADPQKKIAQISEAFRTVDAHLANLSAGESA